MGTRPVLTSELVTRIATDVRAGLPFDVAAVRAGIAGSTFDYWLAQGRALLDDPDRSRPCGTCGQSGTDPCLTSSGAPSAHPHAGRPPYRESDLDDLKVELVQAVESAEADAHARMLAQIQTAAKDTWQAAAWYLERKYPTRYGRYLRTEVHGKDGGPVQVEGMGVNLPNDRLAELLTLEDGARPDEDGS